MLKDFKEKNFNINIFGENGCGKTKFIQEIIEELKIDAIFFTFSHLINIHDLFEKFEDHIKFQISQIEIDEDIRKRMITAIDINKFSELQEILTDFEFFETYIVFDGLTDLQSVLTFKKYFLKIFALSGIFSKRLKIILVSNFDMKQSEFAKLADLSTYIQICFPNIKRDSATLKEIVSKNVNLENYQFNVDEVINLTISNLINSITNLNELIYCINDNLEDFSTRIKNDAYLQNYYNDLIMSFNQLDVKNNLNEEEFKEGLNGCERKENNLNKSKSELFPQNKKSKINEKIHQQICVAPIHLKNLDSLMSIDSNSHSNNRINFLQSTKNLTESLSKSQKILLLASFMAGEISPRMDGVLFKNVRKIKMKIRKFENNSLKTKLSHNFNINRLLAIYSSLKSIIDRNDSEVENEDSNVELIADINTLIHLNLIRYVNMTEYNFMARKMCCNIALDFAKKIADDFNIRLDDFLGASSF